VHLANALESSLSRQAMPGEAPQLDLEYPSELRIVERLDHFREIVQSHAGDKSNSTQFIRRLAVPQKPLPAVNPQSTSDTSPNGFWSRFRSLLAT
jgi:hypothetical protein